jgi:hypothetical protein
MATVVSKKAPTITQPIASSANLAKVRVIEAEVDFATDTAVGATDDITLFTLPKGVLVLALGLEQLEPGVDATNTLVARLGTTALTATLTANAAKGTWAAAVTSTANTNIITTADTTVNLLSAVAARTTGKVRVTALVVELYSFTATSSVDRDVLA